MDFDLIVTNGVIVTSAEILDSRTEIGIKDGKIICLGQYLPRSLHTRILDAGRGYITPGGVDSHVHLAQPESPDGDNWETGTRGAVSGGTTTVLAFASQARGDESLFPALEDYHRKSRGESYCDYGFHFILTNPTPHIVERELRVLVEEEGITSVKLYMTYEPLKLGDRAILDVMMAARDLGITTMIHAENSDMISLITERLEKRNQIAPWYHAVSRPQIAEGEATNRAIALAELIDVPVLIVHVSSELAMNHIREAQTRMLPIHGETCPHYLLLLSEEMKAPHFHGAKTVCSPPLRHEPRDLEAIWRGVANGTFTTLSSDHAPTKFASPHGKTRGMKGRLPVFRDIPNGLPGIETRMPLMFSHAVGSNAKITPTQFVQLTATKPAVLYGLRGVKGNIAPGYDADIVIWYPDNHPFSKKDKDESDMGSLRIGIDMLHHDCDYTPYEGMWVNNWPRYTLLRGQVVWDRDNGGVVGRKGGGQFLKRKKGEVVNGQTGGQGARGITAAERELWL
ncbi:D-hydantoinase [Pleurostoma richardsiae]|uniref:dihydropyrimidinase n=1 Tax=Pleurostoma richardsiae TaxID=41990 RepID=A0AA38VDZ9_9PEZI|nr:D-hydantoinase [Pleurostoma richardsiae]